ncbi:MAG TPA: hypothetical protein ENF23_02870 [Methanosarcinales archaeon]|nr:hypothetical protein [Methanosarcinales archaeon]
MRTKQIERTAKIADDITLSDMRTIAPTVAQPAIFRVNRTEHDHVNDPCMTVANPDASDVFITKADPSSNYCQVMTGSLNVSAGDVLRFNVCKGNSTEFDHTVADAEMCAGGLVRNDAIECGKPAGVCRDVDDDTNVDVADVMAMWYDVMDCPIPGELAW